MENKVFILEKKIKSLQLTVGFLLLLIITLFCLYIKNNNPEVLKAKGLIIEDKEGKAAIMIGFPVPPADNRIRKDSLYGIVLLDKNGTDRLFIGKDSKFQMGGELVERESEGWSFLINDTIGDERGGFGFADEEDRIGLGLDYGGKDGLEAIYLNASNDLAYIAINGNVQKGIRDRIVLWHDVKNDLSLIKAGDKTKDDRIVLKTQSGKPDILLAGKPID